MKLEKISQIGPLGFRILKKFTRKLDKITFQNNKEEALKSIVLDNLKNIGVVYFLYQNFGVIKGEKQISILDSINLSRTKKCLMVLGNKESSIHNECRAVLGYLSKL